jgi:hypothetical protein
MTSRFWTEGLYNEEWIFGDTFKKLSQDKVDELQQVSG